MTEAERCAKLAKKFLREMEDRGVRDINDDGLRYHLALLLRAEGHPTIKLETDNG